MTPLNTTPIGVTRTCARCIHAMKFLDVTSVAMPVKLISMVDGRLLN